MFFQNPSENVVLYHIRRVSRVQVYIPSGYIPFHVFPKPVSAIMRKYQLFWPNLIQYFTNTANRTAHIIRISDIDSGMYHRRKAQLRRIVQNTHIPDIVKKRILIIRMQLNA